MRLTLLGTTIYHEQVLLVFGYLPELPSIGANS